MTEFTRIKSILSIVGHDTRAVNLIDSVMQAALRYVTAVFIMEAALVPLRASDSDSLQEVTGRMDQLRTLAHNALIDSIRICNRHLFKHYEVASLPLGGVYSADPTHLTDDRYRASIGDWAGRLVHAVFSSRHR